MAITKIIIVTDDAEIKANQRVIQNILMDSLYEFQSNRGPTSAEYVEKRYPDSSGYLWLDREKKVAEVNKRKRLADTLHGAIHQLEIQWEL